MAGSDHSEGLGALDTLPNQRGHDLGLLLLDRAVRRPSKDASNNRGVQGGQQLGEDLAVDDLSGSVIA